MRLRILESRMDEAVDGLSLSRIGDPKDVAGAEGEGATNTSSFSIYYRNETLGPQNFKKVSGVSRLKNNMSTAQFERMKTGEAEGLIPMMWSSNDQDFIFLLMDKEYGSVHLIGLDGSAVALVQEQKDTDEATKDARSVGAKYDAEKALFKYARTKKDFPAGWYQMATYRESTGQISPLIIRLSLMVNKGQEVAQVYVPLNKKYYISNVGQGIPDLVFKEVQGGYIQAHDSYQEAKSDTISVKAFENSGLFGGK